MARYGLIVEGKVDNIVGARSLEWIQERFPNAVEVDDSVHIGDLFSNGIFTKPPRNVAAEAAQKRTEIRNLLNQTQWVIDPDTRLTGQQRVQWTQWRKTIRDSVKDLTVEQLADFAIPNPPGEVDEV